MQMSLGKSKRTVLAVAVLLAVAAIFALAYFSLRPQAMTGGKTVAVEIVKAQGDVKTLTVATGAEYLRGMLEDEGLIEGEEGAFGLFVKTVDGVTADDGKQEWWCFTKDGEMLMTAVDDTPIHDGDHYEITLITGY